MGKRNRVHGPWQGTTGYRTRQAEHRPESRPVREVADGVDSGGTGQPPGVRLLLGRRCRQIPWRHVRLGQLLVLARQAGRGRQAHVVVHIVRGPDQRWALQVVATSDGSGVGVQLPALLPLDHRVWQVLDRAGRPARVDPAVMAAANPILEPGAVVRYHGDLTAHHGVYWLIHTDEAGELVLRNDDAVFVRARAASVTVLA